MKPCHNHSKFFNTLLKLIEAQCIDCCFNVLLSKVDLPMGREEYPFCCCCCIKCMVGNIFKINVSTNFSQVSLHIIFFFFSHTQDEEDQSIPSQEGEETPTPASESTLM